MRTRSRMDAVERALIGDPDEVCILFIHGVEEEGWRARLEDARERGLRVRVVRGAVAYEAETVAEAEELVTRHRELGDHMAIVVRRGSETLAEWEAPLPDGLRDYPLLVE